MNSFMKYDHGTLASAYFEHIRHADADFRRRTHDLRKAMYKSTYRKEFYWPEHIPKSDNHQVDPVYTALPKPSEDQLKRLYSPKVIHRNLSDNKRIEPPLEYNMDCAFPQDKKLKDSEKHVKSLYQESYTNPSPSQANKKKEAPDEWTQKWKNECHNVRDPDDLVHDLSDQIIKSQKILFDRKRPNGI